MTQKRIFDFNKELSKVQNDLSKVSEDLGKIQKESEQNSNDLTQLENELKQLSLKSKIDTSKEILISTLGSFLINFQKKLKMMFLKKSIVISI